jgi:hypothetical protein
MHINIIGVLPSVYRSAERYLRHLVFIMAVEILTKTVLNNELM